MKSIVWAALSVSGILLASFWPRVGVDGIDLRLPSHLSFSVTRLPAACPHLVYLFATNL